MPLALVTDPTWVFFVVLMIILFAPILLRRLRIPHIIGLILAGVMIGQHGFNIIDRDRSFEIFGQVGDGFDPELHNAVMHTEDETLGENVISQVFQKGFKIGDKIVRFAMVQVAN